MKSHTAHRTSSDPIYAAIRKHRAAYLHMEKVGDDPNYEDSPTWNKEVDREHYIRRSLLDVKPSTIEGAAALGKYLYYLELYEQGSCLDEDAAAALLFLGYKLSHIGPRARHSDDYKWVMGIVAEFKAKIAERHRHYLASKRERKAA